MEVAWLDRQAIPLYHTTSNHTTYDMMSERVFAELLPRLPRDGPPDQKGLSYFIRRDDLLLNFINTCWPALAAKVMSRPTSSARHCGNKRTQAQIRHQPTSGFRD